MTQRSTYFEPQSEEEARERLFELKRTIRVIETQLNDPLKEDSFETDDLFLTWRQNTKWALTAKLQEYWSIREWLRKNRA